MAAPTPLRRRKTSVRPRDGRLLPWFESLEPRTMLDGDLAPAVVVGRSLSSSFTGGVTGDQVRVTYTVYNQRATPETGVWLTTSLQPGVSLVDSTRPPDRSGADLAWSLGTLGGYDRASVTVTVSLATLAAGPLDAGARAFATVDGAAVTASTPPAVLRAGNPDPSLLAATIDANAADPFVQEQAARLGYDPQRVFDYLHAEIGYQSYVGSVRGARGTLWSGAGDSLDVASLGVALMRASGVPAQYAYGTLTKAQAQSLIVSMFPARYQVLGQVPAGATRSDPANDPALLAETQAHHWFQFDAGTGLLDADPLMPGATVGAAFTAAAGTFTEVPDALREKTEVRLSAEVTSPGFFGPYSSESTVLTHTFNDVELVGKPLTVGNFVSSSGIGFIFTSTTNTYTPYIDVGDEAYLPAEDGNAPILGTPYQEVLTNFPFGSRVLTGLFLEVTLKGPQGASETTRWPLLDRIGYAVRQNGGTPAMGIDPSGGPALSDLDVFTLNASPGLGNPHRSAAFLADLNRITDQLNAVQKDGPLPAGYDSLARQYAVDLTRMLGQTFLSSSDVLTRQTADATNVVAYFQRPRLIIAASHAQSDGTTARIALELDLRRDTIRVIAPPGQNVDATSGFLFTRGALESGLEGALLKQVVAAGGLDAVVNNTAAVVQAAKDQGIPLLTLTQGDIPTLDGLAFSADARARITTALAAGLVVTVPSRPVALGSGTTTAWYETDPKTGETVGVTENGGHDGFVEYAVRGAIAGVAIGGLLKLVILGARAAGWDDIANAARGLGKTAGGVALLLSIFFASTVGEAGGIPAVAYGPALGLLLFALAVLLLVDPPLQPDLIAFDPPPPESTASQVVSLPSSRAAGAVSGSVKAPSAQASGALDASWSSAGSTAFLATSLQAAAATVRDAAGKVVGTGALALAAGSPVPLAVAGDANYRVQGRGTLAVYGLPGRLAASGLWDSYSATASGGLTLTLASDSLTLDGNPLPAGSYTVTAAAGSWSGSGVSAAPDFSGSAAVSATGAAVNLGAGGGNLAAAGQPVDPGQGVGLTGFDGTLGFTAGPDGPATVALNGRAGDVLSLAPSPAAPAADQNTPVTIGPGVVASTAGSYTVTAEAPKGWKVAVDAAGQVSVTPAPGSAAGSYAVKLVARSVANPSLVAQAVVRVAVSATLPGLTLDVAHDDLITVPVGGAHWPTAFRAAVTNLGPAADTYDLTVTGLPAGFTLLQTGPTLTAPAGRTGMLGLYLEPNAGQALPPPGTVITFTVTATSRTDPSLSRSQTVSFTVPALDAVTLAGSPTTVATTPGTAVSQTLTLTNTGNVSETVTLTASVPAGLAVSGLVPLTLAPGQSGTVTVTLTPAAGTPLNSTLPVVYKATFGPVSAPVSASVAVPLRVVVPGADAVVTAAAAAASLGHGDLADRLGDLGTALTNLVKSPSDPVPKSQALANLDSLISQLQAETSLAAFAAPLVGARPALASASTASDVLAAARSLGDALTGLSTALRDLAAHRFEAQLTANTAVALPGAPARFAIDLRNTGTQPTTFQFAVAGLPPTVTGSFDRNTVTLAPGEHLTGVSSVALTLTQTGASIVPTGFTVTVTPVEDTAIAQTLTGSLTVRDSVVRVASVAADVPFVNPGGTVNVSARLFNVVNADRPVRVSFTASDASGQAVFTSTPVAATLTVDGALPTVALGAFATAGLAVGTYNLDVTVTDPDGTPIPGATGRGTLLVGSPVSADLTVGTGGLRAEYFDAPGGLFAVPDFTGRTPDVTRVESQINFADSSAAWAGLDSRFVDTFAARYTGLVNAPQSGSYTFTLGSDDGSKLYVDGQLVVNNDFGHAFSEVSGTVTLTSGFHDIRVEYFENGGSAGLVLSWAGPGFARRVVPASALFLSPSALPEGHSATLPAGDGSVSNTLTLTARAPLTPPFALVGQTATTPLSTTIVVRGSVAYAAGTNGVDIIDVSNPAAPKVIGTFAQDLIVRNGYTAVRNLTADEILVASTVTLNATGFRLLTYSVADPLHPALVNDAFINQAFLTDIVVSGTTALVATNGVLFYGATNNGSFADQFGDVTAVDLAAPGGPAITSRLFGTRGGAFTGDTWQTGGTLATPTSAYFASSTLTGTNFSDGSGRLLVADFSDPAHITLAKQVLVPGTARLIQVTVDGNIALAVGSTKGELPAWNDTDADPSNDSGNTGNLTLTTFDVTDRNNPVLLSTVVTSATFPRGPNFPISKQAVVPTGNHTFAVSLGIAGGSPVIFLVDATDPANPSASAFPVNSVVNEMAASNGLLYTTSADGLLIYSVGKVDAAAVTASVRVPKGTGVAVVPGSFSVPPTSVVTGTDFDTLVWNRRLGYGLTSDVITWRTSVTGLTPAEARGVTLGTTIDYVSQATPGTLGLVGTDVLGTHLIRLAPGSVTAKPGEAASYVVTVSNPTGSAVTYDLAVAGVPSGWVGLAPKVTVAANGSVDVPLTLTSAAVAAAGGYGFVVTASAPTGAADSVQGTLALVGTPVTPPDALARGVVLTLTPTSAAAGQGTSARYAVRLVNTGTLTDTFTLDVSGLPAGVAAAFGSAAVVVPPGPGNFREVSLTLTPGSGVVPAAYPFTVRAVPSAKPTAAATVGGSLTVSAAGVGLSLSPGSDAPGRPFQLTVTNTGSQTDTFTLALGGPAGLVATLAADQVTLAPGASTAVTVRTNGLAFAVPGLLGLTALATSRSDPAVRASTSADLVVAGARGVAAAFATPTVTLPTPGPTTLRLVVANTGNLDDQYSAVITSTTGPVTAQLVGPDGVAARAVPSLRLTGLGQGIIPVPLLLSGLGTGRVTVEVRSLNDGTVVARATAEVSAGVVSTVTRLAGPAGPVAPGAPAVFTAVVAPVTGSGVPTGSVTFVVDGRAVLPPVALTAVNGRGVATLTLTDLGAGTHVVRATYGGAAGFGPSASPTVSVQVVAAAGPQVTDVLRYGYHMRPTTLVVTFDRPLDPARAADPASYLIVGPGGRVIPITSVDYTPGTQTVTLHPAARLSLYHPYRLVVRARVTDIQGRPLGGGKDYVTHVTAKNWVRPVPALAAPAAPVRPKAAAHPTGPARHPAPRAVSTRRPLR